MARVIVSGDMMRREEQGIAYLGVLIMIAIMGIWLAMAGTSWAAVSQREKEQALLDIGNTYRGAIKQYYESTPGSIKRYPMSFDDLLLDRRHLKIKRHLRKLYPDPMTGTQSWGMSIAPDGGIMGVYSLSTKAPLKTSNFSVENAEFENAHQYVDWRFIYVPGTLSLER